MFSSASPRAFVSCAATGSRRARMHPGSRAGYELSIELPGMDAGDVEVAVEGDVLVVSGEEPNEHEEKDRNFYLVERSYGAFRRAFRLPDDADKKRVSAEFSKGVLEINIPRVAGAEKQVRRIKVKSREAPRVPSGKSMPKNRALSPTDLRRRCDPEQLGFATTADLREIAEILGQERAVDALTFGMGMRSEGYNLFALGPSGVGKLSLIRQYAEEQAGKEKVPSEWC